MAGKLSGKTKISLRPLNEEDLGFLSEWFSSFEDMAYFDYGTPVPVSREYVEGSWKPAFAYESPPKALWFVAQAEDGDPLGICGVQSINYIHGDAVIPVFVADKHRGKGIAPAMFLTLIDLAFGQLRLHRLSTMYREDNEMTAKLIASAGFIEEGRKREAWFADGEHKDIIFVGLLKSEWSKKRKTIVERLAGSNIELVGTPLPQI